MVIERVLVIDDEPNMIRFCRRALEKQGFAVEAALSGEEGLRLLQVGRVANSPYDLILLDLNLPDFDGLDVLFTIREMDPEMAVVIITGHGTMEAAIKALKSGAQDFLLKTFTSDDLVTSAQKALEKKRLTQENMRLKARLPILEIRKALMSEVKLERLPPQTLGTDWVSLMLLNEERQELSISAAIGLPDEVVTNTRVKVGQGLAGLAVQRRKPIFRQDDVDLLSILGGQIAVAIENAWLFEQARQEISERRQVEDVLRESEQRFGKWQKTCMRSFG